MTNFVNSILFCAVISLTACSTQYISMSDKLQPPLVSLKGDEARHFLDDAKLCRAKTLRQYSEKIDHRNMNSDFRACLIDKGYLLLS